MKAYTDLEQSKKLAEILPIESADMHYHYDFDFDELEPIPTITEEGDHFVLFPKDVRCWSLTALLGYLNQDWYVNLSHDGICWQCVIDHHDRKERHCSNVLTDEPVDCCVELIVKLKEENLI